MILTLGAIGTQRAIADDPRVPAWAKKTSPWRPDLIDPGRGWWCSDMYCQRRKDDCEPTDGPCVRRKRAWGYSRYSRGSHLWVASAHPSRVVCEDMREVEMELSSSIGVSPCVSVGDTRPPRSKLPPGSGWWCHRFEVGRTGIEQTKCMRTEIECEDASSKFTAKPHLGAVVATCVRSATAWMSQDLSDPSEPLFTFHATEDDCLRHGLSDECKRVK